MATYFRFSDSNYNSANDFMCISCCTTLACCMLHPLTGPDYFQMPARHKIPENQATTGIIYGINNMFLYPAVSRKQTETDASGRLISAGSICKILEK